MGDGEVTLSLLEGLFGCWGMVLMRVVDNRRRLSRRSHLRLQLLLNGNVSQRNMLPLWTSRYPQYPASLEVVSPMVLPLLPIHAPRPHQAKRSMISHRPLGEHP
ncbi:hypothetical protein PILCRDRAFT_828304 [Piloderma croceum F 1598]|uniref:Uncharacterized protein n=1 Tax=Piloderma croceum (strain F 1598) TaxID=765440 RepID=A0A0C3F2Z3_PILCF|nr:hypothetical protein PILCRDRAFT_828304 [Piloderma croceum F 1598]